MRSYFTNFSQRRSRNQVGAFVDTEFGAFLAYLAGLDQKGQELDDETIGQATTLVTVRALLAARTDQEGLLDVDEEHPGYLKRTVNGVPVFVPFNLARVAPPTNILSEVITIARKIALQPDDAICISGSTTFLGVIGVVADLDFCEYFMGEAADMIDGIRRLTAAEEIPLVWMDVGGNQIGPPVTVESARAHIAAKPVRLKMDFVTDGALGILPTTNVILPTTQGEDGEAHQSHAYQEAVIAGGSPVRSLVSPARLGAYLSFLCHHVSQLLEKEDAKSSVKALKRVLSLLLFLGYDNTDRVIALLEREELSLVVNRTRLEELRKMEPHLPAPLAEKFRPAIRGLESSCVDVARDDVEEALEAARAYARATVARITEDLGEYV